MGKQIRFLMDNELEEEFKKLILLDGVILFEGNNNQPIEIEDLPLGFSGKGWFKVYLYKKEFGELNLEELDSGRKYINANSSSVIEFSRTIIRNNPKEISRGRLWLENKYYNEKEELVVKDRNLEEWYNQLSEWIKSKMSKKQILTPHKIYSEYTTIAIKEMVESGYKII